MNSDEIVRALRNYAKAFGPTPLHIRGDMEIAAATIESLQAQLDKLEKRIAHEGFSDLETMISKYKTVMLAANEISIETDEEIEALEAQLSESQRRERAAVEDIPVAHDRGRCAVCKHKRSDGGACNKWPDRSCFEWRGPQEAGDESK